MIEIQGSILQKRFRRENLALNYKIHFFKIQSVFNHLFNSKRDAKSNIKEVKREFKEVKKRGEGF